MSEPSGEIGPPTEGGEKHRKSSLTTLELHLLELACQPVWRAFGMTYLVGTATTGGEYRDVDVRTILTDEDFDRRFGIGDDEGVDGQAFWALVCSSVGRMLSKQTGLPIDYQIQRLSEANEKFQGERNPVGHGHRVYAGGGDATAFKSVPEIYARCDADPPVGMEDQSCILRGPHHFHQWEAV